MQISVRDNKGTDFVFEDTFYHENIQRPVVTERRDVFSFPFGDAELVRLAFSGIYIVYGDMQLREQRLLHYEMIDHHDLVEMHFTLSGKGLMMNDLSGGQYSFQENEHNMHYIPHFVGTGDYEGHERYKFFEVHFTKQFFLDLAASGSTGLRRFADIIAAGRATQLSRVNLPISFAMHQCIRDIMNSQCKGGLKLLFLQSKCVELLSVQAQMYEDHAGQSRKRETPAPDKERILYAREYLVQHMIEPPSLIELARIAGINEFKLKQGFRQVYKNTVYGYLSDYKLDQARELLLSGNTAIKEVADILGYSSVQHFSTAFRKKFGVPPGSVRG